jgi:phosphoribosylformylglycinamidine (FGAM) synthase PurS component
MSQTTSGNIAINVIPQATGGWVCEITSSLAGRNGSTKRFHGKSQDHAIALALEALASAFRTEAEAKQNIEWEAIERSACGEVINKLFHVILHYEHVAEEESKFEAMTNTLLGNTVVENAEIAIIQVEPGLPSPEWRRRGGD